MRFRKWARYVLKAREAWKVAELLGWQHSFKQIGPPAMPG